MIWFVLFQLLGFAAVVGLWFLYGKYFRKFPADSWYDVILDNVKKFLISFAVMFVVLCVVMIKPLYYSAKCSIHGTSMNANTKYSWVMGTCLMETKNKSWIPVKITRGVPDGADNHDDAYGE